MFKLQRSTPAPHRQEGCRFDSPWVLWLRPHSKDMHVSPPGSSETAVGLSQSANGCLAFNVTPVRTRRVVQSVTPALLQDSWDSSTLPLPPRVHASVLADIRKAQGKTQLTLISAAAVSNQPNCRPLAGRGRECDSNQSDRWLGSSFISGHNPLHGQ